MNELNDILKALASKNHSGLVEEKPKPAPPSRPTYEPKTYTTGSFETGGSTGYNPSNPPKVFPSERMGHINSSSSRPVPKRQPFNMFSMSDDDLDFAFSVKVKRGWDFPTWLEVIGFPPDLHPKLDGASYSYAEKAYLKLKQEAHRS